MGRGSSKLFEHIEAPWAIRRRGIYFARTFESVRFETACATLLEDYDAVTGMILWHRGRQGQRLDSPVGTQKNRENTRREVWAPPLRDWWAKHGVL